MNPSIESNPRTRVPPAIPPLSVTTAGIRETGSQTATPGTISPLRAGHSSEERIRRDLLRAFRQEHGVTPSPVAPLSLADFRTITKSDLRRGDILLAYENEPTSENHRRLQVSQTRTDLNNIAYNRGMAEIVHAGVILRDDVEEAEQNHEQLGPHDHPYLSERGGIGTTHALRAIGSAVPSGTSLVYRATDPTFNDNMVNDLKEKIGVRYSSMELGASVKGADFFLPEGLAERNASRHILAVDQDKDHTEWANRLVIDDFSDTSELAYARTDSDAEINGERIKGPGATCSTFISKGIQAALGKKIIDEANPPNSRLWDARDNPELEEKAREAYREFPLDLQIDAKRVAPKTLQHLLEKTKMGGQKMFQRFGKLTVDKMAYPERRFDAQTGTELHDTVDAVDVSEATEPEATRSSSCPI